METFRLNTGHIALAKKTSYGLRPLTYANLTQAHKKQAQAGDGFYVWGTRPYYVVQVKA